MSTPTKNIGPGTLYLIPAPLGEGGAFAVPEYVTEHINNLDTFIVEREKTARRTLKVLGYTKPLNELSLFTLNKYSSEDDALEYLMPLLSGESVGLLSEAGVPCIADPGAMMVELAHQNRIKVVPLVGPSSIMLALMASGMDGQNFAFVGYLPIKNPERKKKILQLERWSAQTGQTQIFMETPYRNISLLEDLMKHCHPSTKLCIACDLTLPSEKIITKPVGQWHKSTIDIHKKPAVFILSKT